MSHFYQKGAICATADEADEELIAERRLFHLHKLFNYILRAATTQLCEAIHEIYWVISAGYCIERGIANPVT